MLKPKHVLRPNSLSKLHEGLSKKGCTKKRDKVNQRIGRLKQRYSRVAQHYRIDCSLDEKKITVLAYQGVQVIRKHLKEKGHDQSWTSLKEIFEVQRRLTMTFKQTDGRALHIRKATNPEQDLQQIYQDLGISMQPGGIKRMSV